MVSFVKTKTFTSYFILLKTSRSPLFWFFLRFSNLYKSTGQNSSLLLRPLLIKWIHQFLNFAMGFFSLHQLLLFRWSPRAVSFPSCHYQTSKRTRRLNCCSSVCDLNVSANSKKRSTVFSRVLFGVEMIQVWKINLVILLDNF